jgi:YfiH family protein
VIQRALTVFTEARDGDMRADRPARDRLSDGLGISREWATVDQVHGSDVVEVVGPGSHGPADGMFTTRVDLPLAIFTADCIGVIIEGDGAVGVAHAGWRGAADGVVGSLVRRFDDGGHTVRRAVIGPHIGGCCFEVGDDVADRFRGHVTATSWGTQSVDLSAALAEQLAGVDVVDLSACTRHEDGWFSHRRDADTRRLAALVVGVSDV